MGERLYLTNVKCAYCGKVQEDEVYYAPTCGDVCYTCEKCKKEFFVKTELNINVISKKLESVTYEDVYEVTSDSANFMSEEQIKACSVDLFNHIRSKLNDMEVTNMVEETKNEPGVVPETEIDSSKIESDDEDSTEEEESDEYIEDDDDEGEDDSDEVETDDTESTDSE